MHTAVVIVRVLSRCDLEAHLIKETYCNSLEVLGQRQLESRQSGLGQSAKDPIESVGIEYQ